MNDLHQPQTAIEFYEDRYEEGYMEEWDPAKKDKIREILLSLDLPTRGKILDFGCGNGVFTRVIKDCLPEWEVFGVEISSTAVKNAALRNPDCTFFNANDAQSYSAGFDMLFSHHVIEHVQNLEETFQIINSYLKPSSWQFHVLPCGNTGSFEYRICELRPDGFRENNLFFFEEPGHLQRLDTEEFVNYEKGIGFQLAQEYYSNQLDGAIDWITKSSPRFVKRLTDPTGIPDQKDKLKMENIRKKLLPLTYSQFAFSKFLLLKQKRNKSVSDKIKLVVLYLPAKLATPLYDRIQAKARAEWERRKSERNGSEMFLVFKR